VQRSYLTSEHECSFDNGRHFFTPAQANKALVLVRRIVADVVTHYTRMLDLHEALESALASRTPRQTDLLRDSLIKCVNRLQSCQEELSAIGVELRDWALGIVDFPCRIDGRIVCLCWRYGEKDVHFWHEAQEGFASRRSTDELDTQLAPHVHA